MDLAFAQINLLQHDIAEVIINDGVELDVAMVKQYHQALLSHLSHPFSLLINKVNSYAYTFDAQIELATLKEINAMAVVTYNKAATSTTQYLTTLPRETQWNLSIFSDRDEAFTWLQEQQRSLTQQHN